MKVQYKALAAAGAAALTVTVFDKLNTNRKAVGAHGVIKVQNTPGDAPLTGDQLGAARLLCDSGASVLINWQVNASENGTLVSGEHGAIIMNNMIDMRPRPQRRKQDIKRRIASLCRRG